MDDDQYLRLPSIDGLRAFEAAARLGSFERAADALHVTASAVGKRIGTLEDLLGTALLTRAGKGLVLTSAGQEYLLQVRGALDALAAVPLHQHPRQRRRRLRVCVPPTFARQVLMPQLESFTRSEPLVELEIVLSIPYLAGSPGDGDVEVRYGDPATPATEVLTRDTVRPVAAPALLARLPPLAGPADLRLAPLLRSPLEPWAPWFRAAGLAWPEPADGPRLLDLGLLMEAALSGQGVALARPSLARGWLASGALRPLFDITAVPASQYLLLPHAASEAALAFVAWLRGVCAEISGMP